MIPAVPTPSAAPPPGQCDRIAALIDSLLDDPQSPGLVRRFYDRTGRYAGSTFLDVGANDPFSFGVDDLYAVTLLNVNPGVVVARRVLPGGDLAAHTAALLARIPLGVPIWLASDRDLEWAGELWSLLVDVHDIGPTTAGKLVARKRPELIPIVDSVVGKRLECAPNTYWSTFRTVLQDPARRVRITAMNPRQPELRVLDTLLWMHWNFSGPRAAGDDGGSV